MNLPPELLGPYAALVLLIIAVGWLARDHQARDKADRATIDKLTESGGATAYALKELAEAAEERERRGRRTDGSG